MLTHQEIYDRVKRHLLNQNKKSQNNEYYLYFGSNGLKCAVGVLLCNRAYNSDIEGKPVTDTTVQKILKDSGVPTTAGSLLGDLQSIHDDCPVEEWADGLRSVAVDHGLEP